MNAMSAARETVSCALVAGSGVTAAARRNSRMDRISRRQVVRGAAAAAVAMTLGAPSVHAQKDRQTLRFVRAGRSEDSRSDLDDRLHHAQPRLSRVRHAVRHGRKLSDQAADGRSDDRVCGRHEVHVHAARRPPMARRAAGRVGRLRGVAEALGKEGSLRPAPHGAYRERSRPSTRRRSRSSSPSASARCSTRWESRRATCPS